MTTIDSEKLFFGPTSVDLQSMLHAMLSSREFDRRAGMLSRQGKAWFHISSSGHEALAGAAVSLRSDDFIFPHYRDRALLMMRGMSVTDMTRDLIAAPQSHSGGRNMGSHFSSREHNVFSIASPVGSQCLPAAGAAWTQKLTGTDNVVLCSIGEASTRQGEFFEAVAWAVDCQLPIIFLVSDNGYGISTPTTGLAPVHRPVLHDSLVRRIDGVSPVDVAVAVGQAAASARIGRGPTILWCDLDRLDSHTSSDDHRVYRDKADLAKLRDPVDLFAQQLIAQGLLSNEELEAQRCEIRGRVDGEVSAVLGEAAPDPSTIGTHLYSSANTAPIRISGKYSTIVEAVNGSLRHGLEDYPDMVLFGEDIEDPKGGVFGFTKGLGNAGGGRVFNSPLAEATIVGAAVGLAATGKRPVVELQFVDFVGPAWNQITNQLATLRWRTMGSWSCPVVMYAPYGAYLPGGGIWHSQSNEAMFTHIPGLKVVVVSHADDTEAAFLAAFASEDPTLILLPKHLMRMRDLTRSHPVRDAGRARVVAKGEDITVVAWGNCVELAVSAATELAAESISVEVIDLVWLSPWDRDAVSESLAKTGRLVVVEEDNRTSSFGASVLTEMATNDEDFFSLAAPPRLVSRPDIHIPFHPILESAVMPSVNDVVNAIRSTLN
ncbi:thiamine pyrophosphate-dependent enzyme [Nocardia sp. NBC_01009]|uniref:alpha-ketoacid dehydrogenase subunit alpha/beta n=1 Tax=Nocardia sp. NBC_01009 TaxID=2975996 RepID=UPI00386B0663|nr:thiamine pyrophosphate-dependent enzyme [Nocardia sp. NBC_01009]